MRKITSFLGLFIMICGCCYGIRIKEQYHTEAQKYGDIKTKYTADLEEQSEAEAGAYIREKNSEEDRIVVQSVPENAPDRIVIDWAGLQKENPDVIAWIDIPQIKISYPVVQSEDNSFYLHKSFSKEDSFSGAIFMDAFNSHDFSNFNTILYGHNMRDGSMFAGLKECNNEDVYQMKPYFWIYTPEKDFLYQIFSVHKASEGSETFLVRFENFREHQKWKEQMAEQSNIQSDIEPESFEKILTLSTCTETSGQRQVVQAVQVLALVHE